VLVLAGRGGSGNPGAFIIASLNWIGLGLGLGLWATTAQRRFVALYRAARGGPAASLDEYMDRLVRWEWRGWPNALTLLRRQPDPVVEAARRAALRRLVIWFVCVIVTMPLAVLLGSL